jgi:hypothetical protein
MAGLVALINATRAAGFPNPFAPHHPPPAPYPAGCLWVPVHGPLRLVGATVAITATFPTGSAVVLSNTLQANGTGRASAILVVPVAYVPAPGLHASGHRGTAGIAMLTGVVSLPGGQEDMLPPNRVAVLPPTP